MNRVREYTHITIEFDADFHMGRSEDLLNVVFAAQRMGRGGVTITTEQRTEPTE